jgi:hypothetical protein
MKNVITSVASGLLLSAMFCNTAAAMSPASSQDIVGAAFAELPAAQFELLDEQAMDATEGKALPMLAVVSIIGGVVTVDLGLIAAYWGIYVPYYAPTTGNCVDCNDLPLIDLH